MGHLVHPVHRRRQDRTAFCSQGRRAAKLTNRHRYIPLRIAAYCRMRNIASMHRPRTSTWQRRLNQPESTGK
ncbi:hypothetical protein NK6_3532 [Bradyrhizobium diazoefficiens]|uniref:Uncharacterized protein n=2 Tax=Bradyrhizobium diazoefficiens TaxID=1355477 RepID=A0A837C7X7_9BRAD|nr:hypothetical protein BJA5080_01975 [Bradyrhizobium diazoefficiens SEMIA 5080]BAR56709.1 hypothetical protein NK6_3532 [Bradyrhizobium diazoefficiens]